MKLHLVMVQALQAGDLEEADRCQQQLQVGGLHREGLAAASSGGLAGLAAGSQ